MFMMYEKLENFDLSAKELAMFEMEYESKRKKESVMWVLWALLGGAGAHRFYLKDTGLGIAMLVTAFTLGILTVGITSIIWVIIDAFLISKRLKKVNDGIKGEILQKIMLYRSATK
jgi:TM2 domain-containing membrane protein YozV